MPQPEAATATRDATTSAPANSTSESATADAGAGTGEVSSVVGNSAFARALENGGYFIDVGPGITISPDDLSASVNLADKPQVLPGVRLRELRYRRRNNTATLIADVAVPHLRSPRNGIRISINAQGQTSLDVTLTSDLPVFKNKTLQLTLDEQNNLAATLTIEPTDLTPRRGLRNLTVTGGGTFQLANGKLSGNMEADLTYATLGSGHFTFNFNGEGRASGSGNFEFDGDYLNGASAQLEIDEEANLKAVGEIPISDIQTPIAGLSITEGSVRFSMENSTPSGALENLKLVYNGLGEATISASIRSGRFSGRGSFAVTVAELTDVSGRLNINEGILSGTVTIRSSHFPRALGVESGQITGTLQESGDIDFEGEATINLGPAGSGRLSASKANGVITIGTIIMLENIPGLQSAQFTLVFTSEGGVEGEADVAIDESLVPGLSGSVRVTYRENLWAGETEIGYSREDPSVNGSVTVNVRQTEEGTLVFSGSGDLSAEVIPGIEGSAGVVIDEEGKVILSFAFTQTDPYELFPENRHEREFLNVSQNIPLFAGIVVAVIRIRAGVRAGVGPGQIRNSRIEGSWEVSSEEPPDLTISSEFYMPAFVEGYVAFGAGLGVDVLLGSLTGGIEAMATAGLYGAISVVPELSYENGDWMFDGTATLAAGARLKLSLNAWAEVEALWITVWEQTWELASHTMNVGPDLVLTANVSMNLSNPSVPELTFDASDTDTGGLIDSALPKDGPPGAGTREAIENRAQWAGRSREPGPNADSVPSELASQANQSVDAPNAPARPAPRSGPPAGQQQDAGGANNAPANTAAAADTTGAGASTAGTPSASATGADSQNASARAQDSNASAQVAGSRQPSVPESEVLGTDQPRYARPVTLETLNEPPAPMPRTVAQEGEDLRAAEQVLSLVENQVENSEQLATYFARLQRRFQLTSVGYVAVGNRIGVELAINPKVTKFPDELAVGRSLGGKTTSIRYTPGSLDGSGDTVGLAMVADPLGPDYEAGSPPSGQSDLMRRLTTTDAPANQKFVRGHLLNDLVGGEGRPRNLFPITAAANQAHERQIESRVKQWVNVNRYWVYYKVEVAVGALEIKDATKKMTNKVNSRLICEASVYDLEGDKRNTIKATISSTFNSPSGARITNVSGPDQASEIEVDARQEDLDAEVELSTRVKRGEYSLPKQTYDDLTRVFGRGHKWNEHIKPLLIEIPGMGESRANTLIKVYNLSTPSLKDLTSDLNATEKSNLTRIKALVDDIRDKLLILS